MKIGNSLKLVFFALCIVVFALDVSSLAQQPKRVFKIGYLTNDPVSVDLPRRNAFREVSMISVTWRDKMS